MTAAANRPGRPGRLALGYILLPLVLISWLAFFRNPVVSFPPQGYTLAWFSLTFILGMNAYATPVLLGGPRFQMMGPVVDGQFAGQNNWPFGAALAFVLMTATLLLTVASNALVQRRYRR